MRTENIEKRLNTIERQRKPHTEIICCFRSQEDTLAGILSGGMKSEVPGVIEIDWDGKMPTDDAFKLRWLRQLTPEELDRCKQIWAKSDQKRDKVALAELERLSQT